MTTQPGCDSNLFELGKKLAQRVAQYAASTGMPTPVQDPERLIADIQQAARNTLTTRNYAALSRAETELDYYGGDQ